MHIIKKTKRHGCRVLSTTQLELKHFELFGVWNREFIRAVGDKITIAKLSASKAWLINLVASMV